MYKRLLSTTLVFGAAALAPPTEAQSLSCMPRETLINRLESKMAKTL